MSNFKDVDTYLEHFGKPGMKWGQRKSVTTAGFSKAGMFSGYKNKSGKRVSRTTVRIQKSVDASKAVASGKKGFKVKLKAAQAISFTGIIRAKGSLKKASATKVSKGAAFQKKSNAGKAKVRTAIGRLYGVRVSDLNFK